MAKNKHLPISLTDREKWQGFVYLVVELCFLPSLLHWFNGLLIAPISRAWLNFLYFSLNFVFIVFIFKGFFKRCLFHAGHHFRSFLIAAVPGFCVYWLANFLLGLCIQQLLPDYANLNDSSIAQMTAGNFAVMALGTVILVPVAEETLHRGLIFGTLYASNKVAAYIISTLLFALIHVAGYIGKYDAPALIAATVQYLPAGLILAWAYRKSGSIFAPILIHIANNAVGIWLTR